MSRTDVPPKQIARIYAALAEEGCETAAEVAEFTGLPQRHCSTYLARLAEIGAARRTGRVSPREKGRPEVHYEPIGGVKCPASSD